MPTRTLGQNLDVSALGLGCMGMTWAYGATDEDRGGRSPRSTARWTSA
jgi:aryl-alcohol dehydrogenase-like predicted oxidoreductase